MRFLCSTVLTVVSVACLTPFACVCVRVCCVQGRVGASEVELVQRMIDGVDKLIDMEESA